MKLATEGSELYLGGTNEALHDGPLEYHAAMNKTGWWEIGGAAVRVNGEEVATGFSTIVDSGTTLVLGPPEQVKALYSRVCDAKMDEGLGLFVFPCNSTPSVEFSWGGNNWPISAEK